MKTLTLAVALLLIVWWLKHASDREEFIPYTKLTVEQAWARVKAANPHIVDLPFPETTSYDPRLER